VVRPPFEAFPFPLADFQSLHGPKTIRPPGRLTFSSLHSGFSSTPLLLPKKLCQQRLLFPVLDLKAFIQRKVRCIRCELPHSQCPLLPWASALSSDVRFLDFVPTPGCWFQILADPTARTTQVPSAARRLLTFTASVWSYLSPKRKKLEQARVYDHAGCLPNRRHHFE